MSRAQSKMQLDRAQYNTDVLVHIAEKFLAMFGPDWVDIVVAKNNGYDAYRMLADLGPFMLTCSVFRDEFARWAESNWYIPFMGKNIFQIGKVGLMEYCDRLGEHHRIVWEDDGRANDYELAHDLRWSVDNNSISIDFEYYSYSCPSSFNIEYGNVYLERGGFISWGSNDVHTVGGWYGGIYEDVDWIKFPQVHIIEILYAIEAPIRSFNLPFVEIKIDDDRPDHVWVGEGLCNSKYIIPAKLS